MRIQGMTVRMWMAATWVLTAVVSVEGQGIQDLAADKQQHYTVCKSLFDTYATMIAREAEAPLCGTAFMALEAVQAVGVRRELVTAGIKNVDRHPALKAWAEQGKLSISLDAELVGAGFTEGQLLMGVEPITDILWRRLMRAASYPGEATAETSFGDCMVSWYEWLRASTLDLLPPGLPHERREAIRGLLDKKILVARIMVRSLADARVDGGDLAANLAGSAAALQRYGLMCLDRPDPAFGPITLRGCLEWALAEDEDLRACMQSLQAESARGTLASTAYRFFVVEGIPGLAEAGEKRVLARVGNVEVLALPLDGNPSLAVVAVKAHMSLARATSLFASLFVSRESALLAKNAPGRPRVSVTAGLD